jgi:hypothetical protein
VLQPALDPTPSSNEDAKFARLGYLQPLQPAGFLAPSSDSSRLHKRCSHDDWCCPGRHWFCSVLSPTDSVFILELCASVSDNYRRRAKDTHDSIRCMPEKRFQQSPWATVCLTWSCSVHLRVHSPDVSCWCNSVASGLRHMQQSTDTVTTVFSICNLMACTVYTSALQTCMLSAADGGAG